MTNLEAVGILIRSVQPVSDDNDALAEALTRAVWALSMDGGADNGE